MCVALGHAERKGLVKLLGDGGRFSADDRWHGILLPMANALYDNEAIRTVIMKFKPGTVHGAAKYRRLCQLINTALGHVGTNGIIIHTRDALRSCCFAPNALLHGHAHWPTATRWKLCEGQLDKMDMHRAHAARRRREMSEDDRQLQHARISEQYPRGTQVLAKHRLGQ